jgi:hypothetical protein
MDQVIDDWFRSRGMSEERIRESSKIANELDGQSVLDGHRQLSQKEIDVLRAVLQGLQSCSVQQCLSTLVWLQSEEAKRAQKN